jgi:hypothetical protein
MDPALEVRAHPQRQQRGAGPDDHAQGALADAIASLLTTIVEERVATRRL